MGEWVTDSDEPVPPEVCGDVRIGNLSGRMGPCSLPAGHEGEWHQWRIVRRDGSKGALARWPVRQYGSSVPPHV